MVTKLAKCNREGRQNQYFRVYIPPEWGIKYNLRGQVEITEDEANGQLILKKHMT